MKCLAQINQINLWKKSLLRLWLEDLIYWHELLVHFSVRKTAKIEDDILPGDDGRERREQFTDFSAIICITVFLE